MTEILPGLKGHDWEAALLITRFRGRGVPRVVDDAMNLNIIFRYRADMPTDSIQSIKNFLQYEYNLTTTDRKIKRAIAVRNTAERIRLVDKICAMDAEERFPDKTSISKLMERDELKKVYPKIIAEALTRLGYSKRKFEWGFEWSRPQSSGCSNSLSGSE